MAVSNSTPHNQAASVPKRTASPKASTVDKTLTKGLAILEALSRSSGPRGISDLAEELCLTKSNVHRLLQTLVSCGYVVRDRKSEKYLLSSKLWRLSRMHQSHRALVSIARPILRELVRQTGETATFAVIEGEGLVMIDQIETPQTVRVFYEVGDFQSLDQVSDRGLSALQQVAYAYRSESSVREALLEICKEQDRPEAFVTAEMEQIRTVKEKKFAVSKGVWVDGVNAVAAPVESPDSELVGVLVSFGPALRLLDDQLNRVRECTCVAAARLSSLIRI